MAERVKSRRMSRSRHQGDAPDELVRVAALCRTRPLLDVVELLVTERRESIIRAADNSSQSLLGIAREVAACLEKCSPRHKALACVGAEVGFLVGIATMVDAQTIPTAGTTETVH